MSHIRCLQGMKFSSEAHFQNNWSFHVRDKISIFLLLESLWDTITLLCHFVLDCWCSGKESTCQCRRHGFDPWVGKIPWRRKWQPTPVFLTGKFLGQRKLVGCSPWGWKESDMSEQLSTPTSWALLKICCHIKYYRKYENSLSCMFLRKSISFPFVLNKNTFTEELDIQRTCFPWTIWEYIAHVMSHHSPWYLFQPESCPPQIHMLKS